MGLKKSNGFTLIELLIAITIVSMIFGLAITTLKMCLDIYHAVQIDVRLEKVMDEMLQEVSDGNYDRYGIRDGLEVVAAGRQRISFVPLWTDDTHTTQDTGNLPEYFTLNRPFKPGSSLPIGEVFQKQGTERTWKMAPIELKLDIESKRKNPKDKIRFTQKPPIGSKTRFIYHPDSAEFPDTMMTIAYEEGRIKRLYRNKTDVLARRIFGKEVVLTKVLFQYFNNMNIEIQLDDKGMIPQKQLQNVTAVKLNLEVELAKKRKQGSVFINIRNTSAAGAGILLQKGMTIPIPDSKLVRTLSLANVVGIKDGGTIQLEARSESGRRWLLTAELRADGDHEMIRRYSVGYPSGETIYAETVNLRTDLPLNFLTLGGNGRYDYDYDGRELDAVTLEGPVELWVLEMDAAGASLFVRP